MAHLHRKIKNGRAYYYLREIQRVNGKPTVVKQVYLGTADRLGELAQERLTVSPTVYVEEFGALWLAHQALSQLGIVELIDAALPRAKATAGLSVGEYFYYAALNRLVEPLSKCALEDWYRKTAIQGIRPTRLRALTSSNYWKAWDKVSPHALRRIATALFEKLSALEPTKGECFIFDTTNYFTFIAPQNEQSTLAQFGKSKEGRNGLRQVSLALLVGRESGLPLFYREFPGNMHDSRVFADCMHSLLSLLSRSEREPAVFVFDKGMTAPENIAFIDRHPQLHFITAYVPTYLPELLNIPLDRFTESLSGRCPEQSYTAYRTTHTLWKKSRTVIVLHNPLTAKKQQWHFEQALQKVTEFLSMAAARVAAFETHWRDREAVLKRISDTCAHHKIPMNLFAISFQGQRQTRRLHFNIVDSVRTEIEGRFGKQILVSDLDHWSTSQIVAAYLDRFKVELAFRQSKDAHVICTRPFFHWTDSKVRCHLLTCFVALCAARLLELRLQQANLQLTASAALEAMKSLHAITRSRAAKLQRQFEVTSDLQHRILAAFGAGIDKGVLHTGTR